MVTLGSNGLMQIGNFHFLEPLLPETFFSSHFEMQPKIGWYRLPTHERDAHKKFFPMITSYFKNEISTIREQMVPLVSNRLPHS